MTTRYQLPVRDTLATAWHKVHGSKKTFWAAIVVLFLTAIGFAIVENVTRHFSHGLAHLINGISQITLHLMQMGMLYLGILRARETSINYRLMFRAFDWEIGLKVIGTYILLLLIFLSFVFLIAFSLFATHDDGNIATFAGAIISLIAMAFMLFFSVRLFLALGLALDIKANPINAIKTSWKSTGGNFWRLLAVLIIQFIIVLVSAIPFGIGLIWTIPFIYNLYGTVYNRLTQVEPVQQGL